MPSPITYTDIKYGRHIKIHILYSLELIHQMLTEGCSDTKLKMLKKKINLLKRLI